jgi:hypothetical protein
MSSILIHDVRKSYGGFEMLHGVTAAVALPQRQDSLRRNSIPSSVNGPREPR